MTTVSPNVCKRLLYAKYLLFRAKQAQAERSELGMAMSLLLMHDASEVLMLAVADHLQLGSKWNFMEFWEKVKLSKRKEPGHRIPMEQLNSLRVGFKHKGILPHAQTVRDLMPRVNAFCEDTTQDLIGTDFSQLSLSDLIGDNEVRAYLRDAEQAMIQGDKQTAYLKVRLAFDSLRRSMSNDISLLKEPRGIRLSKSVLPNEAKRGLLNLQGVVFDVVGTLNVLMLGIDPVRYRFFMANTPAVSWSTSGRYQALFTHDYDDVPDSIFQSCLDFVVEAALNASR